MQLGGLVSALLVVLAALASRQCVHVVQVLLAQRAFALVLARAGASALALAQAGEFALGVPGAVPGPQLCLSAGLLAHCPWSLLAQSEECVAGLELQLPLPLAGCFAHWIQRPAQGLACAKAFPSLLRLVCSPYFPATSPNLPYLLCHQLLLRLVPSILI